MSRFARDRSTEASLRAFHGLVLALAVIALFTARSLYVIASSPDLQNMTPAQLQSISAPWIYGLPAACLAFVVGCFGSFLVWTTTGPRRTMGIIVVAVASLLVTIAVSFNSKQVIGMLFALSEVTFLGAFVFGPMILVVTVGYAFWRRARAEPRLVWKAAVHGAAAAATTIVVFTAGVLYTIGTSQRSTAALGIIAIPTTGLALAVIIFLVAWMLSVLTVSLRAYLLRRTPR